VPCWNPLKQAIEGPTVFSVVAAQINTKGGSIPAQRCHGHDCRTATLFVARTTILVVCRTITPAVARTTNLVVARTTTLDVARAVELLI
jgi:hypothetical protein